MAVFYCSSFLICLISPTLSSSESRVPDPPVNIRVEPESDSIKVEWDPPPNAEELKVRGYTVGYSGGGAHVKMALSGETTNEFSFITLEPDTEYDIILTAFNDVGDSRPFVTKTRTKSFNNQIGSLLGPFPPVNLQVDVRSPTSVELSWEDQELEPNDIPDGYREYTIRYGLHNDDGALHLLILKRDKHTIERRSPNIIKKDFG